MWSALAPNTASLLISRFLGGFFGAAPLTNSAYAIPPSSLTADRHDRCSALLGDLWDLKVRGNALAFLSLGPLVGPTVSLHTACCPTGIPLNGGCQISPMVSGFMTDAGVSWRWVFGLLAIFTGSCTILVSFTMPETYE